MDVFEVIIFFDTAQYGFNIIINNKICYFTPWLMQLFLKIMLHAWIDNLN